MHDLASYPRIPYPQHLAQRIQGLVWPFSAFAWLCSVFRHKAVNGELQVRMLILQIRIANHPCPHSR
jgi:hypothetical protein